MSRVMVIEHLDMSRRGRCERINRANCILDEPNPQSLWLRADSCVLKTGNVKGGGEVTGDGRGMVRSLA